MSGSVSGTLGHTLNGNMTFIGSLLNGTSFSYSGPVSIDNGGSTVFNYTGTWAGFPNGSTPASGTASGTTKPVAGLSLQPDGGHLDRKLYTYFPCYLE